MSIDVTGTGTPLSVRVAEEIRAWMGRRKMSQAQLARRLNVSAMWVSYRLNGVQPIDLNDLQRIADVLDVTVVDLLPPAMVRPNNRSAAPAIRMTPQPRRVMSRPNGRPRPETTRPVSAVPASRRRPRPVNRPMAA